MKAPSFELPDQNGEIHKLSDYLNKWLIVYFYPRDDTPGCTKEACSFRDSSSEFKKLGVEVVGISKDTVRSHKKFETKYKLNFTLLADPEHKVIEAYGAWGRKKFMGREFDGTLRNTYIVNPKGEIVKSYEKVNPLTNPSQILQDLASLV
ncbi:MAG TPA: thioredoxin-dependent thiol peroxidase [Patescibacteria group bacterium]|nr:thioredoxin-dependent thiol peroxidase [Patescibacteria group bacterium]